MPIIYNEQLKIFKLDTPNSTYAFKISPSGFLLHLYYGAYAPDADLDYLRQYIRASTTSALTAHEDVEGYMSLDTARLEYSGALLMNAGLNLGIAGANDGKWSDGESRVWHFIAK